MKPTDIRKFATMMTGLGKLYGKVISEELGELYWNCLQGFSWEEVNRAVHRHLHNPDTGQFMPKPADITRHITGSAENMALRAWTKVNRSMGVVGGYDSVEFDDPVIHAVIRDMGGWIQLCHTDINQLTFRSSEFQKRYRGYLENPANHYPTYLVGMIERDQPQEYKIPAPVKISCNDHEAIVIAHHPAPAQLEKQIAKQPDSSLLPSQGSAQAAELSESPESAEAAHKKRED